MKINKLPDLFEIQFNKTKYNQVLGFLKMCIKYHSRLFDDEFYKENFSSPEKFLKFLRTFKDGIFCVTTGKTPNPVAFIYLYEAKKVPNGAMDTKVTFCVSRPYWGFGSYAIAKKAVKFLFENLNVRKLTAEIVGENTLARTLLLRLGFNLEAMLTRECFKNGKPQNLYIFTKFNPALDWCSNV